jgi:hypothetical protein
MERRARSRRRVRHVRSHVLAFANAWPWVVGDSLAKANHGARILTCGGSNMIGHTGTNAPLISRPSNVTSRFTGVTVSDWSTLGKHGPDVYLVAELGRLGFTGPILLCNEAKASTNAFSWESTEAAVAIASWNTLSPTLPPNIILMGTGGQDCSTLAQYQALHQDTLDAWQKFSAAWGAGFARIIVELPAPQGVDFPYADVARIEQRDQARLGNDCTIFVPTYNSAGAVSLYELLDDQHRSAVGQQALGLAMAPPIYPILT